MTLLPMDSAWRATVSGGHRRQRALTWAQDRREAHDGLRYDAGMRLQGEVPRVEERT